MTQPIFLEPNRPNKMMFCGFLQRLEDRCKKPRGKLPIVVETHNSSEAFASVWGLVVQHEEDKCLGVPSAGGFLENRGEVLSYPCLRRFLAVRHLCAAPQPASQLHFHNNGPRVRIENDRKLGHPSNVRSAVHGGHPSLRTPQLKPAAISRPFGPRTSKII